MSYKWVFFVRQWIIILTNSKNLYAWTISARDTLCLFQIHLINNLRWLDLRTLFFWIHHSKKMEGVHDTLFLLERLFWFLITVMKILIFWFDQPASQRRYMIAEGISRIEWCSYYVRMLLSFLSVTMTNWPKTAFWELDILCYCIDYEFILKSQA